jgi:hypothetical protein
MNNAFLASLATAALLAGPVFAQSEAPSEAAPVCPVQDTCSGRCSAGFCCPDAEPEAKCWGRADYLLWWLKDGALPVPLVTAGGTFSGNRLTGAPGSTVLIGSSDIDFGAFSGGRVTGGSWLDSDHMIGFEMSGFLFEGRSVFEGVGSDAGGNPTLSRPFVNAQTGQAQGFVISAPRVAAGEFALHADSRLWGGEANLRLNLDRDESFHLDLLCGFRHLGMNELLLMDQRLDPLAPGSGNGNLTFRDRFYTNTMFYGAQAGLEAEYREGGLSVAAVGKLAMGTSQERVDATSFGLLVQPTNHGRSSAGAFAVVPEVDLRLGYQLTQGIQGFIGYDFLYWSNVVRPGDQIDRVVNVSQIGGAPLSGPGHPARSVQETDFWAQGLSFGLQLRF